MNIDLKLQTDVHAFLPILKQGTTPTPQIHQTLAAFSSSSNKQVQILKNSMPSSYLDIVLTPQENSGYPVCKVAIAPVYQKDGAELLYPDGIEVANHHTLKNLAAALQAGERAVLVLLAQRIDCIGVRAQWTADASYMVDLKDLYDKGLEIICCGCSVSLQGIWVTARLPFMF